jgi:hypothetical protein
LEKLATIMSMREGSITLFLGSALCFMLHGCLPAPYGAYYRPSYPDPSATLSKEYCGGQAGPPSTLSFNAPEGVIVSVSAPKRRMDSEQERHLRISMSIPAGTRLKFLADGFELAESLEGTGRRITVEISLSTSLKLGIDNWVDIEQFGPTDAQTARNFAASNPEHPITTARLSVPNLKSFAPDTVSLQMPALSRDGKSTRPPPIELLSDSRTNSSRVYRTKPYLQALEERLAKCRTETPQRKCGDIARYDAEGLRFSLDDFTLSGRFWVWDVQTNTPFSSEVALTTNDVTRWRFAGPEIRFTDLATDDIRQDRMGPMLVSWKLKVPFATAIRAVDTGESPSTRLVIESSLGTRDASKYVIRLPPVQINGREYILKPIELELHRFDGGFEPFNC